MTFRTRIRLATAVAAVALVGASLAACSGTSGGDAGGKVTLTFSSDNGPQAAALTKSLVAAFEKANPDITVKLNLSPGGDVRQNQMKTALANGTMDDVFLGYSGSQLQSLHPDQFIRDESKEPWAKTLSADYKSSVAGKNGAVFGAPIGTTFAGGIMYNKKVYEKLGLSVPATWDDFIANSKKIKAAGITPVLQTFGDTWTSQLFVLADFANISGVDKDWAADYTANKADAKYAKQPGLAGFEHTAQVFDDGLVNADYASLTNANGLKLLATGQAAQYPMITNVLPTVQESNPDQVNDIGYFAMPASTGSDPRMTVWGAQSLLIPKTTTGAKLDAAKKLLAFSMTKPGCDAQAKAVLPTGPFATSACTLPSDVPTLVKDEQAYADKNASGLALEFLSPIKGPNLEQILISVATGQDGAQKGAELYDQDVTKQAQQLGLKGW